MQSRKIAEMGRGTPSRKVDTRWFLFAAVALFCCWGVCFYLLMRYSWHHGDEKKLRRKDIGRQIHLGESRLKPIDPFSDEVKSKPIMLSRIGKVIATADVRGNLGPASVVVQTKPGDDWIHDRWQAASDMHGTAIKGAHWIHLDFGEEVIPEQIILDWEAAYSDRYRLEASHIPITDKTPTDQMWTIFDSTDPKQKATIGIEKKGQSPGVADPKTPLHVIHTFRPQNSKPFRYLRLYILGSAMGWGVSLWQFDVIGHMMTTTTTRRS